MCEHCILGTFPSPVIKYHRHITRVGVRTHVPCNSRAVSDIFSQDSGTYWVYIGVWVKTKINILYPRCKLNIFYKSENVGDMKLLHDNCCTGSFFRILCNWVVHKDCCYLIDSRLIWANPLLWRGCLSKVVMMKNDGCQSYVFNWVLMAVTGRMLWVQTAVR